MKKFRITFTVQGGGVIEVNAKDAEAVYKKFDEMTDKKLLKVFESDGFTIEDIEEV